jgi:hypothetical protein
MIQIVLTRLYLLMFEGALAGAKRPSETRRDVSCPMMNSWHPSSPQTQITESPGAEGDTKQASAIEESFAKDNPMTPKLNIEVWILKSKTDIFEPRKVAVLRNSLMPVGNVFKTTDVAYSTLYVLDSNEILLRRPTLKNARDLFGNYFYAGTIISYEEGETEFGGENVRTIKEGWVFDPSIPSTCITFNEYEKNKKGKRP